MRSTGPVFAQDASGPRSIVTRADKIGNIDGGGERWAIGYDCGHEVVADRFAGRPSIGDREDCARCDAEVQPLVDCVARGELLWRPLRLALPPRAVYHQPVGFARRARRRDRVDAELALDAGRSATRWASRGSPSRWWRCQRLAVMAVEAVVVGLDAVAALAVNLDAVDLDVDALAELG